MKNRTVCIHILDYLLRYAAQEGLSREELCAESGLEATLFDDPDTRIRAVVFIGVWRRVSSALRDDRFGLNLGRSLQHFPFSHLTVSVMLNSHNLMAAFENLVRYHNLMSDMGRPTLLPDQNGMICFAMEPRVKWPLDDSQFPIFILSMLLSLLRYLGNAPDLHPVGVDIQGSGAGLTEFFGTRVTPHGPVSRMVFRSRDLDRKIQFSNPDLLRFLEQEADYRLSRLDLNGAWRGRVGGILETSMNAGPPTLEVVAKQLHLEPRTLQNYLKKEGSGFRRICMESRRQKAIRLLSDPSVSIVEIAFILGFSEQSAFNHAFKRWTGATPKEYRKAGSSRDI
jgi:AraC-like DNA-binding protein